MLGLVWIFCNIKIIIYARNFQLTGENGSKKFYEQLEDYPIYIGILTLALLLGIYVVMMSVGLFLRQFENCKPDQELLDSFLTGKQLFWGVFS